MPLTYTALQHPIRYAAISSDARFIAVAGRRGLTHYNALSGRWKLFESEVEEESVRIAGGMAWWSNVLIAGCVTGNEYQVSDGNLNELADDLTPQAAAVVSARPGAGVCRVTRGGRARLGTPHAGRL